MADLRQGAHGRRDWRRLGATLLLLTILVSFVAVQTAAAISSHPDHEGPKDHCCAACHGGHYPVLQTGTFAHIAQLIEAAWYRPLDEERLASRESNAVNSSRAPPA